ncbi:MAG: helix-turn-helix domain-containing protein [Treponema sp.]|nr:helix-turn-helix domain-containing protein [Treponema sp.]
MKTLDFWDRVGALLKAHGMTQKRLAELIGTSQNTLERWKRYNRIPSTQVVYFIAINLGVSSNFLLGGEEKDIAHRRKKELEARRSIKKIEDLLLKALEEARKIKPLQ